MTDFSGILKAVINKHNDANKWVDAEFEKIKRVSNSKVGDVGQDFIEELCKEFNLSCEFPLDNFGKRARQSPWDIKIEGIEFELKTATEDVSGSFQFNHLRYHRNYMAAICLGVTPNKVFFGVWSKAAITTGKAGNLVSMEKGANASYKLTKKPKDLQPIEEFYSIISKFSEEFS